MKYKKTTFLPNWIILNAIAIFFSYLGSLIAVVLVHGAFGFGMDDWGTHVSNLLMHVAAAGVLGMGVGLVQWGMINKELKVSFNWMWLLVLGLIIAELLAGILLWQLDVLRGQINLPNAENHWPETGIFTFAGLIVGFFQWFLIRKRFKRSGLWIVGSMLGWGVCMAVTTLSMWAFVGGVVLYGCTTGIILKIILKNNKS